MCPGPEGRAVHPDSTAAGAGATPGPSAPAPSQEGPRPVSCYPWHLPFGTNFNSAERRAVKSGPCPTLCSPGGQAWSGQLSVDIGRVKVSPRGAGCCPGCHDPPPSALSPAPVNCVSPAWAMTFRALGTLMWGPGLLGHQALPASNCQGVSLLHVQHGERDEPVLK